MESKQQLQTATTAAESVEKAGRAWVRSLVARVVSDMKQRRGQSCIHVPAKFSLCPMLDCLPSRDKPSFIISLHLHPFIPAD